MRRVVSVWFPDWPLDRLRRSQPGAIPGDEPFALVLAGPEAGNRGQILHAVNEAARRAGLQRGLALADARAALPALLTRPAETARDRMALRRLALWAGRFGPRRHTDGEDGLWIDVTGVAHLFGGEADLMADLVGRLGRAGIRTRAALADTFGTAFALARYAAFERGRAFVIAPAGGQMSALSPLPVDALRLEPSAVVLLKRLGLRRIGQLYDLSRAALERRFREEARGKVQARRAETASRTLLARLDAALGKTAEPRRPLVEPPEHRTQRLFAEPLISHEGLETATAEALAALVASLAGCGLGVRRIRLVLFRADGSLATLAAGTSAPTRDAVHLLNLIAGRLATIDAGFGIDALVVEAARTEEMVAADVALAVRLPEGSRQHPARFFDRLTARLGAGRVIRLAPLPSHWPDHGERTVPVLAGTFPQQVWPDPASRAPRPPLLLTPPEPIAVIAEIPEGPPARFTWRRVAHRVVRAEGPERIEPEWWLQLASSIVLEEGRRDDRGVRERQLGELCEVGSRHARTRDYYRIEDEQGGRFWIFREGLFQRESAEGPPKWYLHGLFG